MTTHDYEVKEYFENMGFEYVHYLNKANFLVISGGADIDPYYYGGKNVIYSPMHGNYYGYGYDRDGADFKHIKEAHKSKKKIIGICRGLQSINVAAGGFIVSNINDHRSSILTHKIKMLDGSQVYVNSRHHQMVYPFNLSRDEYSIIGWSEGLSKNKDGSPHYQFSNNLDGLRVPSVKKYFSMPMRDKKAREDHPNLISIPNAMKDSIFYSEKHIEPEIVMYHRLSALGFQYHPEDFHKDSLLEDGKKITEVLINAFLDDRL